MCHSPDSAQLRTHGPGSAHQSHSFCCLALHPVCSGHFGYVLGTAFALRAWHAVSAYGQHCVHGYTSAVSRTHTDPLHWLRQAGGNDKPHIVSPPPSPKTGGRGGRRCVCAAAVAAGPAAPRAVRGACAQPRRSGACFHVVVICRFGAAIPMKIALEACNGTAQTWSATCVAGKQTIFATAGNITELQACSAAVVAGAL